MDLISKEDAVALIKAEMDKIRTHSLVDGTARINLRLAKNIIEDMPSIDIVRCKECRHWCCHNDVDYDQSKFTYYCEVHGISLEGDEFCSFGEREGE